MQTLCDIYTAAQVISLLCAVVACCRRTEDPRFEGEKLIYRS